MPKQLTRRQHLCGSWGAHVKGCRPRIWSALQASAWTEPETLGHCSSL